MLYGLIGENVQFSFSKQIHKNLHSPSYELWSLSKEHFLTFLKQKILMVSMLRFLIKK